MHRGMLMTSMGPFFVETADGAVIRAGFGPGGRARGGCAVLEKALAELLAYFEGRGKGFSVPVSPEGTPFQRRVWRVMEAIPYGRTRTYGEVARRAGSPGGARAAGGACGANPIPVIVPCHRVTAAGSIGGFGAGLEIKRRLLALEQGCRWSPGPGS